MRFESSLDLNRNGILDGDEVQSDLTSCYEVPEAGFNNLVALSAASEEDCPHGGQRIESGLNDGEPGGVARNGVLEPEEIEHRISAPAKTQGSNPPIIERVDPGSADPMGGQLIALDGQNRSTATAHSPP